MRNYLIVAVLVVASWAGAFGIAVGVVEWRSPAIDRPPVDPPPALTLCGEWWERYWDAAARPGIEQWQLQHLLAEWRSDCP